MIKINIDHLSSSVGAANIVMHGSCEQLTVELGEITIEVLEKLSASMSSVERKKFVEAFITAVYKTLIK